MGAISVGGYLLDMDGAGGNGWTYVSCLNPAIEAGILTSVTCYVSSTLTGSCKVGIWSAAGNVLSGKVWTSIALKGVGLQTWTDLSLAVAVGDYIGFYFQSGRAERSSTGGVGYWSVSGDQTGLANITFALTAAGRLSIQGDGPGVVLVGASGIWMPTRRARYFYGF